MTKIEAAKEYVEELDYIADENRRIAGEGFIAGANWQQEELLSALDDEFELLLGYFTEEDPQGGAEKILKAARAAIEKRLSGSERAKCPHCFGSYKCQPSCEAVKAEHERTGAEHGK